MAWTVEAGAEMGVVLWIEKRAVGAGWWGVERAGWRREAVVGIFDQQHREWYTEAMKGRSTSLRQSTRVVLLSMYYR